jgi:hypothetical protein
MITIGRYFLLTLLAFSFSANGLSGQVPQDPSAACFKALQSKPELQILKGKVDIGAIRSPTQEMLANTNKPTQVEMEAISTLTGELEECLRQGEEWREKNWPPAAISLFEQYVVLARSLMTDLYEGKITYSNFAKNKASSLAKFKADLSEVAHRLIAERKAQEAQQTSRGSAASARSIAPEDGKGDDE